MKWSIQKYITRIVAITLGVLDSPLEQVEVQRGALFYLLRDAFFFIH